MWEEEVGVRIQLMPRTIERYYRSLQITIMKNALQNLIREV